jgi:hypothetical protein
MAPTSTVLGNSILKSELIAMAYWSNSHGDKWRLVTATPPLYFSGILSSPLRQNRSGIRADWLKTQ